MSKFIEGVLQGVGIVFILTGILIFSGIVFALGRELWGNIKDHLRK